MTRGNARELAVHLIYAREFTGDEPQKVVADRLEKEYYANLDIPGKREFHYAFHVCHMLLLSGSMVT